MIKIEQGKYLRYWHVSLLALDDRKYFLIIFEMGFNELRVRPSPLLPISRVLHLNRLLHDISVPATSPVNYRVNVPGLARNGFQSVGLSLTKRLPRGIGDAVHAARQKCWERNPVNGPRTSTFTVLFVPACCNDGALHCFIEQLLGIRVLGTPDKQPSSCEQT